MQKITLAFYVNSEYVPGLFYDPNDFAIQSQRMIETALMAYKPRAFSHEVQTVTAADAPDHPLGYTESMLMHILSWELFQMFKDWMKGKTIGVDPKLGNVYYTADFMKFIMQNG